MATLKGMHDGKRDLMFFKQADEQSLNFSMIHF